MLKRTHSCNALRPDHVGETVVLAGWVNTYRDHSKALVFIDLRDRTGLTQIVFDLADVPAEIVEAAQSLRREDVIAVRGTVRKREGGANPKLATGEVEAISPWAPVIWPFNTAVAIGLAALWLQALAEAVRHGLGFLGSGAVRAPNVNLPH